VVGNEELVTAEAGRRVALSSGGRVVHVVAGDLSRPGALGALGDADPDIILLVGGTDHGNAEALLSAARALAFCAWPVPVVVAGNVEAQAEASEILSDRGVPHMLADNVVPRIGLLAPESARAVIRATFLVYVIGGKHLSSRADFTAMVRGATPDVVLSAVRMLAQEVGDSRGVAVVDVGGATTDVHSAVELDPEDAGLSRQVVAPMPVSRTVEGDLGMRWSAVGTVEVGREEGLLDALVGTGEYDRLVEAAERRHADPSYLPDSHQEHLDDERLATVAVGLALRRHAGRQQVRFGPDGRLVERTGKDLRDVGLLVGSGGVLRHHPPEVAQRVLGASCGHDIEGGWLLPRATRTAVDRDYVLAAAGLLVEDHPDAARALLRSLVRQAH
jgi:uncharacterized protein (TIGR01319 family)